MRASHTPPNLPEATAQDQYFSPIFKSEISKLSQAAVRLWNTVFEKEPVLVHKAFSTPVPVKSGNLNCVITPENTTLILELLGRLDPQAQSQLAEALSSEDAWSKHPDVLIQFFQAHHVEQLPAASKVLDCLGLKNPVQANPASLRELNRLLCHVILPMMKGREISRSNRLEQMSNWICDLLRQPTGLESLKSLDTQVLISFEKILNNSSSNRKLSKHKTLVALIRKAALIKQVVEDSPEKLSHNYRRLDKESRQDKDMVLAVCARDGLMLDEIHEPLRRDRDVVLAAVRSNGKALACASNEFRSDKEVVTEAVRQHGLMLLSASSELKADREVVLEAVRNAGMAILYANSDLRSDYEIALAVAAQDPSGLFVIDDELKDDLSIIQKAVARDGAALQDASDRLKDDLDIVLTAVTNRGTAIQYASARLRGHGEVVKTACLQNPNSIQFAIHVPESSAFQARESQVAK